MALSANVGVQGAQVLSSGVEGQISLGAQGDGQVSELHGKLYTLSKRNKVYTAQTAVTGVAPGTSIGTTGAFALYNPAGSGIDLAILKVFMGYISGTLGAGTVFLCLNNNPVAAAVTGTAITEIPGLATGTAGVGVALTTATMPATSTPVLPLFNLTAALASTAVAPYVVTADLDGAIIIPPGCSASLQAVAAGGSTPLVAFGMVWEEVTS